MKNAKALVKFDFDVAVITALDAKYKDIQTAEGTKPYALVMAGLAEYRTIRSAIDDQHKKLKADILLAGRSLDGDKTRLKTLLQPGESRLRDLKNTEDDRKDAIKAEKEAKERDRKQRIEEKIVDIRHLGVTFNMSSSDIEDQLRTLMSTEISEKVYQEFKPQALEAQNTAVVDLEKALADRTQFEKEEENRKAEAERLEAQRKEQEAKQASIDKAYQKIKDAQDKLEADKKAEQDRKEKEEWEKDEKARLLLELEERKAEAEQKRLEKEEAEKKEKARQEALKPDKEKLIKFAGKLIDLLMDMPNVKSTKAQKILDDASNRLGELHTDIKEKAQKL